MSRLHRLALVAALFAAAAPALASEREPVSRDYIGFEFTLAPPISIASATDGRAAPGSPGWEPIDAATYAGGYVFLGETVDPIALIEPGPGPDPALLMSSSAVAAAAAGGGTAGTASPQLACACPCH